MYLRIPPISEKKTYAPLSTPIVNQYDILFKRKEEIVLRINAESDSDDSVDIYESPSEDLDLKKSKQFLMSHQMPNKGIVN